MNLVRKSTSKICKILWDLLQFSWQLEPILFFFFPLLNDFHIPIGLTPTQAAHVITPAHLPRYIVCERLSGLKKIKFYDLATKKKKKIRKDMYTSN